jgi:hypothetical protein
MPPTRPMLALSLVALSLPACASAKAPEPDPSVPAILVSNQRVGGDTGAVVERRGEYYYSGPCAITTPLPDGYPPPTPPGAIEIKSYPAVRRAQVSGTSHPDWGMNMAFWPLFRHISRRDIAMTSPVEIDYEGLTPDKGDRPDRWTMSFLYRTSDLGPVGTDRAVEIVDAEPMAVAAIGFRGSYSLDRVRQNLKELILWVEKSPDWEPAGEPRALFYNGPEKRGRDKWGEVQVPIRRAEPPQAPRPPAPPDDAVPGR